jgi:hypothetical protein
VALWSYCLNIGEADRNKAGKLHREARHELARHLSRLMRTSTRAREKKKTTVKKKKQLAPIRRRMVQSGPIKMESALWKARRQMPKARRQMSCHAARKGRSRRKGFEKGALQLPCQPLH